MRRERVSRNDPHHSKIKLPTACARDIIWTPLPEWAKATAPHLVGFTADAAKPVRHLREIRARPKGSAPPSQKADFNLCKR